MSTIENKLITNYWLAKLKDHSVINNTNYSSFNTQRLVVNKGAVSYFNKLTTEAETAEFTVLLTIFNILLQRYFETGAFVFSPGIGQKKSPLLYLLHPIEGTITKQYLQEIKTEVQEVYKYADYDRNLLDKLPFSQYTSFAFSYKQPDSIATTPVPFSLKVDKNEEGLLLTITYAEVFTSSYVVVGFLENIKNFLHHLESYLNQKADRIPIITEAEKQRLLYNFNDTAIDYPADKTLVSLFEEQVNQTPAASALVYGDKTLRYDQLNEAANQLAYYLRHKYAIQSNDLIALQLDKTEQSIIAILGILKSGAAYVPIDVDYPESRKEYILQDSRCKLVFDEAALDSFNQLKNQFPSHNISPLNHPHDLAYVMYTSGTTGKPKGVMVEHRNIVRLVKPCLFFPLNTNNVLLSTGSSSFDATTIEYFGTLLNGAQLVIATKETLLDVQQLEQALEESVVDSLWMTASWFSQVVDANVNVFKPIKQLIVGGDVVSPVHVERLFAKYPAIKISNGYGPTENTTFSTTFEIKQESYHRIPIGKPIANSTAYILDDYLEPLPPGVFGKLYVSGAGVARGYWNRPDLTEERFILNPFVAGVRMYDTGDIARWLPDGNIDFWGRKDSQVKIRGFRIESSEIEQAILQFSTSIRQVVVMAKASGNEKELIAYYVVEGSIEKSALRDFLKERLPAYMVPGYYMPLAAIPLTPNGKVDRRALPDITADSLVERDYQAPRNEVERQLVAIWEEVLGLSPIGITDNFFELGGHSLMVGQIINRVYEQLGKSVPFRSFFETPIIAELGKKLLQSSYSSIPKAAKAKYYPLTTAQQRIWVLCQLEGGSLAYNMSGVFTLKGPLDVAKFEEAFRQLIHRHEILRTIFEADGSGEIHQYILPEEMLEFNLVLEHLANPTEERLVKRLKEDHNTAFDLEKGPLLRASLLKTREEEALFSLTMHHIIGDGWSIELLIAEVVQVYNQLVQNKNIELPELAIQYKDYAVWLKAELEKEHYTAAKEYWLTQFEGELPILDLPAFRKRPAVQTYNGKTLIHRYPASFLSKLKQFSKANNATLFMTLMAGVNALIYRYTNQNDLIIGTPIAGREHRDLEGQIGLFLNTLAIRTQLEETTTFSDLLQQQKQTLVSAYEHQIYPFDELVNQLNLKRDSSRSALFDVMVVLQNQKQLRSISTANQLEDVSIEFYEIEQNTSQFDLSLTFVEDQGLELSLEYNTDIYEEFLIERIFAHLETLMVQAIDHPEERLTHIDFITSQETTQLLTTFNGPAADFPKDQTMVDLWEAQVSRVPENTAIVFENQSLTYRELNRQANQLARYLTAQYQVKAGDLIALKLERSEQLLIVILGILKSGAAYVPIDTNYPAERVNYIQEDSHCKVLIDEKEWGSFKKVQQQYSSENLPAIADPSHLAYVIYTSGTTGHPKGVMVTHRNVVSIYSDWKKEYQLDQFDINLLQLASVSFDVFAGDICRSLLNGGKMVIPSDNNKLNPEDLYALMVQHQISIFEGTPGLVLPLLDYIRENKKDIGFLKLVIFGSDSFNNETFNKVRNELEGKIRVVNSYGLTEATIDSTYYDDYNTDLQGVTPIGKPFPNTAIFILNSQQKLVPTGVYGEIYIGGSGVSKGYHNRPELTQKKFVNIPFQKEKVYATGDIARWLPDGNIAFLGRGDQQIKLRGYRIELGEIESALNQFSEKISRVVLAVKEINREKTLVAYYTASENIDKTALKSFLLGKLPSYMIPSFYFQLATFPLTSNGKIDTRALPNVSGENAIREVYNAPENKTETQLVKIWEGVLGIEKIGTTDNFFELGGHSLKITKLRNQVNRTFNTDISFNDLFTKSTIKEQAELLDKATVLQYQTIPQLALQNDYVLSSAQRRIWILSQFEGGSVAYNMPGIYSFQGDLNVAILEKAFATLIERHEALRTRFVEDEWGEIRQIILPATKSNFKLEEDSTGFLYTSEEALKALIVEQIQHPFDLAGDSLIRATLTKISEDKTLLIFVMHHIISDGWSIEIITNELFLLYNAYQKGIEPPLEPLSIQYKDYASWEQGQLAQQKTVAAKDYWLRQFEGDIPLLELPTFKKRPLYKTYDGKSVTRILPKNTLHQLKQFCQSKESTLFMGLLASVKLLLYKYTNQKDLIIGTPIAGREHAALQNQVGVYINTLALRTRFSGQDSFEKLLKQIKKGTLDAYQYQWYPFDKLVEDLPLRRDLNRNPLFDVMVTLQNTDNNAAEINTIEGISIEAYQHSDEVVSKFDLEFIFEEMGDALEMSLVYNTNIFSAAFPESFFDHLQIVLDSAIRTPELPIYQLPFLKPLEIQLQVADFNQSQKDYPKRQTFLSLFQQQVDIQPNAIALEDENQAYSYAELATLSNQIANYLHTNFETENTVIGLLLNRSANTIALLLGILKSGSAYIPLDPTFPIERLQYIVEHSGLKLLITDEVIDEMQMETINTISSADIFKYCQSLEGKTQALPSGEDTAYIIYTSGSTGHPKGVEVGHRSLLNFLLSMREAPGIKNTDTLFAVTTYSFDISILEFFTPLISGARVYVASNETLSDPEVLIRQLNEQKPSVIQGTPSFYQLLFNAGWKGDQGLKILCGGDALNEPLAAQLLESGEELWNMYGPTETTIWSSIKKVKTPGDFNIIGKPIANTALYVLNEFRQLLPPGAIGNLYIGGDGLAKGYYGNKKLTDERFVDNPFGEGKIYETGDTVKWNQQGELQFIGRNDNQVKIRGYRIELAEIEIKINKIAGIQQAVVTAKKDVSNNSRLVAYYTHQETIDQAVLKTALQKMLPDYMIPSLFVRLDAFPLTPNKKIDRKALALLNDVALLASVEYLPPQTEVAQKLALLWQEVLGVERVGLKDHFFDLGGHSLSVTKLVSMIQKEFSFKISMNKIFEEPVLENQAALIENTQLVNQIQQNATTETETEFENFSI